MPTYEYVCDDGHETEARQSMDDDALEVCPSPDCGASARRRITGGGGFLMGDGGGASGPEACGPSCCRTSGGSGFT